MEEVKILIGADIVPTDSNMELFCKGNAKELIGDELLNIFMTADYIALNLETPLTDQIDPIAKCGPSHSTPLMAVQGLKAINPYFYTLANNHILDQGEKGIISTVEVLSKNGINYSGFGTTSEEKATPFIASIKGYKVGFYCCAEHEFSITEEGRLGVNPFDALESFDHVRTIKNECDILIVLYHGGKEYYQYPSPMLQKVFRKFAASGADVVIAQHSHCIGCMETYQGSMLVYGQGNFIFDDPDNKMGDDSLLIQLNISGDRNMCVSFFPIIRCGAVVRIASSNKANEVMKSFNERCNKILDVEFVKQQYNEYAIQSRSSYNKKISGVIGKNIFVRILNKLFNNVITDSLYKQSNDLVLENIIECEAHRELFLAALKYNRLQGKKQ